MKTKDKHVQLGIQIEAELKRSMDIATAWEGISLTQFVIDAIKIKLGQVVRDHRIELPHGRDGKKRPFNSPAMSLAA